MTQLRAIEILLRKCLPDLAAAEINSEQTHSVWTNALPALRLCLDRIAPPRKDRPVHFDFPPVSSAADAAKAAAAL
jgi:hypothetical protein